MLSLRLEPVFVQMEPLKGWWFSYLRTVIICLDC